MSTAAPLVELRGVTRRFRQGDAQVLGVSNVDLTVHGGEFVVVAGPSGSGKSSLLHLMAGLDDPDEGTVTFEGSELRALDDAARAALRRRRIGFVFQAFNLVPVLSAYENVEYGLWLNGVSGAARRRRALAMLEAVGLAHRATHRPDHLSGGERQRVAIARALVNAPSVVFADEPTASLDSATAGEIVRLLVSLNQSEGTTFVVATHDPRVMAVAPRVVTIVDGRVAAVSPSDPGGA
ncbi:MAG: ABC transporter ATP-binding protein [Vicinamibacterales bacterium]